MIGYKVLDEIEVMRWRIEINGAEPLSFHTLPYEFPSRLVALLPPRDALAFKMIGKTAATYNSDMDTIPLTELPYAFRKCLQQFAPLRVKNNFITNDLIFDNFVSFVAHEQVFITDNHVVSREAIRDTFLFRFCKCLDQFKYWRKTKDGRYSVEPVWKSVLLVDEFIDRDKDLYVDDSLILHCHTENYEKVIPKIVGSYSRLVLHCTITWDQLKRLVHPGLKQIRVSGIIHIEPTEYNNFVAFLFYYSRGLDYTFSFFGKSHYDDELLIRLKDAFRNHETHSLLHAYDDDMFHIVHKDKVDDFINYGSSLLLLTLMITVVVPIILLFVPGSVVTMPPVVYRKDYYIFFSVVAACLLTSWFNLVLLYVVPLKSMDIISEDPTTNRILYV
uniref:Uncharacterized protein n=1 Tax=Panagrellus redivivus TaxID=6233 RepID=A0A7E4W5U2_PANRE